MINKKLVIAGALATMLCTVNAEDVKKGFVVEETTVTVESIQILHTVDVPKITESKIVMPRSNAVPQTASRGYSDTIVYARSSKSKYVINEPITVQVKLKRDAFVYFWTVSHDGKGYLILPNNFESFNTYKKDREYVVPEKSADYQFISDRAGTEIIHILATNKRINTKKLKEIFGDNVAGIVPVASKKSIKKFLTKDIQVIAKKQSLKFVVRKFQIEVVAK